MPIFLLIIISILGGTAYYLAHRIHQGLACFFPKLPFLAVLLAVCALALIFVLGFARSMLPISAEMKHFLGITSAYSMGILFYLFLFTILADLLMLVPQLMKLQFTQHTLFRGFVIAMVLFLTSITSIYGFIHGRQIAHVSYEIPLKNTTDISDLNVVLISDLHLGAIGSEEQLKTIVDEINSLQPDIICIAGDFFDTDFASIQNPKEAIQTLKQLNATHGTYACLGNHDGGQTFQQMTAFLEKANIQLLNDTYTTIDDRLILLGRLDASPIGGYDEAKRQPLASIFTREDRSLPVIVLDHNPANIDEYNTEADLVLCGHTHKGQVFPGGLLTDLLYTVDYGYYQKSDDSPHVIVSSGVGSWGMPMRVGTNCEIVSIHFSSLPKN